MILVLIFTLAAVWIMLAVTVALIVGRMIELRDQQVPQRNRARAHRK